MVNYTIPKDYDLFLGESVEKLNRVYARAERANKDILEKICNRVSSFREIYSDIRSGEYDWFGGVKFNLNTFFFPRKRRQILVLFPWKQDQMEWDGTKMDRSISVYTLGRVSKRKVRRVLRKIRKGLEDTSFFNNLK